jgi:hypothetical protein
MVTPRRPLGLATAFGLAAVLNWMLVGLLWAPNGAPIVEPMASTAPFLVRLHSALPAAPVPSIARLGENNLAVDLVNGTSPLAPSLGEASAAAVFDIPRDAPRTPSAGTPQDATTRLKPVSNLELAPEHPLDLSPQETAAVFIKDTPLLLQIELDAQGRIHAAYPLTAIASEAQFERIRQALIGRLPLGQPSEAQTNPQLCIEIQLDPSSAAKWQWLASCPF